MTVESSSVLAPSVWASPSPWVPLGASTDRLFGPFRAIFVSVIVAAVSRFAGLTLRGGTRALLAFGIAWPSGPSPTSYRQDSGKDRLPFAFSGCNHHLEMTSLMESAFLT